MTAGSHRRKNLLTGGWVLVSPHRLMRPWQGALSPPSPAASVSHDPDCYLCAGNLRSGGIRNPPYDGVFVFENDFPALLGGAASSPDGDILIMQPEDGVCRVICYSPRHDLSMSAMSTSEIRGVVNIWRDQQAELSARAGIGAIVIFENRGEMMGASSPHPHGQIWATRSVPSELSMEDQQQSAWQARRGRPLLAEYLERELLSGERVVCANEHFVVVVPFWAAWPFETLLLPRRAVGDLSELDTAECNALAAILSDLTRLYDAVFDTPFPYTMGWHQRPVLASEASGFILHAHFYPPLLRSASVRKFMVGFEMLGMPQRDITPEDACLRLRAAGERAGISTGPGPV